MNEPDHHSDEYEAEMEAYFEHLERDKPEPDEDIDEDAEAYD